MSTPELTRKEEYTEEEAALAGSQYNHLHPYLGLLRHVLTTRAKNIGEGFSIGGEPINGKVSGALHVYCSRSVIPMAPVRKILAEYLLFSVIIPAVERDQHDDALAELEMHLDKWRTDSLMKALEARPDAPEIKAYLAENGGYCTVYGKAELKVRRRQPNAGVELLDVDMDGTEGTDSSPEEYEDE